MLENKTRLSNGVDGLFVKNTRFNTTLISFNFFLPLEKESVAVNALLPFMLTTSSKKYPDFSKLNLKLSKLYGAQLSASSEKVGDYQLLKMAVSVIGDKYTLDDESLTSQACELLSELIFEPNVENGTFLDEDVEREKRKAIQHIQGEMSEKRIYAKQRLIEEMYKDEPYGLPKCGTVEQVEKITGTELFAAWERMLKSAYCFVDVVSNALPIGFFDEISKRFDELERVDVTVMGKTEPTKKAEKVNTVTERLDVAQGKLVMGFSMERAEGETSQLPALVMTDIFGGAPYSRLFTNVREKMSLCYYCAASSVRVKGLLTVDSGVEEANVDKAQKEILNQLQIVKNGEFTDFEYESSLKGIADSLRTYNDSQELLDTWYSIKAVSGKFVSPDETAEKIASITKEQIIAAAKTVSLHTVYRLLPKEVK